MSISYLKMIPIFLISILIINENSIAQSQEETTPNATSKYEPESGWGNYFTEQVRIKNAENIEIAILSLGGNINAYNEDGDTALHVAIKNRYDDSDVNYYDDDYDYDMVEFLLVNGADPNLPDAEGNTPLILIVSSMIMNEELKEVIESQSSTDIPDGEHSNSTAYSFFMYNTREIIFLLLEEEIDIDLTNYFDQTALEISVRNDLLRLAGVLLRAGADADIRVYENGHATTIRDMLARKLGLL